MASASGAHGNLSWRVSGSRWPATCGCVLETLPGGWVCSLPPFLAPRSHSDLAFAQSVRYPSLVLHHLSYYCCQETLKWAQTLPFCSKIADESHCLCKTNIPPGGPHQLVSHFQPYQKLLPFSFSHSRLLSLFPSPLLSCVLQPKGSAPLRGGHPKASPPRSPLAHACLPYRRRSQCRSQCSSPASPRGKEHSPLSMSHTACLRLKKSSPILNSSFPERSC